MKRWPFAVGAVAIAAAVAGLALRSCSSPTPPAPVQQVPARVAFHASKPLHVVVNAEKASETEWLERELRYLLARGKMRIAPVLSEDADLFTLRIDLDIGEPAMARAALVAGDGVLEREIAVPLADAESRLDTVRTLAQRLPDLLGVVHSKVDWSELIGTEDAAGYANYLRSSTELFGPTGRGFTGAMRSSRAPSVDRLESLTRKQPKFARAWSALALAYLSLGGEDNASLVDLAETTVERALAIEPNLADAQSALGLIRLYRNEWTLAKEHFDTALAADPNSIPALEGLACLLVDVGQHRAALPAARRAVALQPSNAGAQECLAYAQLGLGTLPDVAPTDQAFAAARVRALVALLSKDIDAARQLLRNSQHAQGSSWIEPLLRAAANSRRIPGALQAITRAANDREIDRTTEIVSGAALKQSEFVFNRMLRLHRDNEAVPLRLLWLPQTSFLRAHPQFDELIGSVGLPSFWQDQGAPDVCALEPSMQWCGIKNGR